MSDNIPGAGIWINDKPLQRQDWSEASMEDYLKQIIGVEVPSALRMTPRNP